MQVRTFVRMNSTERHNAEKTVFTKTHQRVVSISQSIKK